MRRVEGETSEPQGPPCPIKMAQARWEAISQIYGRVDGKNPPPRNIASEALRAYYSGASCPCPTIPRQKIGRARLT